MAANLADLNKMLDRIRTGDRNAVADWLQTFLPGTCFLIQRRLGKPNVEAEARSVLDDVLREIQADGSVTAEQLPGLIRRLICQLYPAKSSEYTARSNTARVKDAERILHKMSPLERDALRRCYVLGEAPELILGVEADIRGLPEDPIAGQGRIQRVKPEKGKCCVNWCEIPPA